jgi:pyridoxal phosphate enzyme (YggS family)
MTENILTNELSVENRKEIFDENYIDILEKVSRAAIKSGRKPEDIKILAATKTIDTEVINYAIKKGITLIGENRVQEFLSKESSLDTLAERHFIGHLQTNKVKDIVGKVTLIHSVHSFKLAKTISDISEKRGIVTDILLEVNIGDEESKSGFKKDEIPEKMEEISKLKGISIKGLMAIPPICEKNEKNRQYFKEMYKLFLEIKALKIYNSSMDILSMGMSDDFDTAIEEGATLVRIGTALFGKRNYKI